MHRERSMYCTGEFLSSREISCVFKAVSMTSSARTSCILVVPDTGRHIIRMYLKTLRIHQLFRFWSECLPLYLDSIVMPQNGEVRLVQCCCKVASEYYHHTDRVFTSRVKYTSRATFHDGYPWYISRPRYSLPESGLLGLELGSGLGQVILMTCVNIHDGYLHWISVSITDNVMMDVDVPDGYSWWLIDQFEWLSRLYWPPGNPVVVMWQRYPRHNRIEALPRESEEK